MTKIGPDFIGVGMERTGTSWLFKMLAAHPEIWVPPIKELHYFDRIDKGFLRDKSRLRRHMRARLKHRLCALKKCTDRPELYKNNAIEHLIWDWHYFIGKKSDQWYQALFKSYFTKGRVAGEITPGYANIPEDIIKGVVEGLPDTKFIMLLRDPFERLKSGMLYHFKVEQKRLFHTVQDYEMQAYINREDVREKSSIAHVLPKWSRHVKSDNFFICAQNNMSGYLGEFLEEIYSFLGVDPQFKPDDELSSSRVNVFTSADDERMIPSEIEALMRQFADEELVRLRVSHPDIAAIFAS